MNLKKTANIISYVFHPLLAPTYGMLFLLNSGTYFSMLPDKFKYIVYLIIFVGTCLLPLSFMPFFLYNKLIKKITLDSQRERYVPLITTALAFYFTYYINTQLPLPAYFPKYLLAATVSVVLALIITIKWKISLHMIGMGGLAGFVFVTGAKFSVDVLIFLLVIIALSGLVGSARLYLKSHNSLQIYSGFLLGFLVVFSFLLI